jgi:hypothetical protein
MLSGSICQQRSTVVLRNSAQAKGRCITDLLATPRTTPGGQPSYSPLAILTALTLRAVFRLAYLLRPARRISSAGGEWVEVLTGIHAASNPWGRSGRYRVVGSRQRGQHNGRVAGASAPEDAATDWREQDFASGDDGPECGALPHGLPYRTAFFYTLATMAFRPAPQRMFVPSSYRCSSFSPAPSNFEPTRRPGSGRFCELGLGFQHRNDTENLSRIDGLSPELGGWPI